MMEKTINIRSVVKYEWFCYHCGLTNGIETISEALSLRKAVCDSCGESYLVDKVLRNHDKSIETIMVG